MNFERHLESSVDGNKNLKTVDGEALACFYDSFNIQEETRGDVFGLMGGEEVSEEVINKIKIPQEHKEVFARWGVNIPDQTWANYVRNMLETTRFNYNREKGGYNDRGLKEYASFFGFDDIEKYANFINNLFDNPVPILDIGSGRHLNNLNFLMNAKDSINSVIDTTRSKVINLGISNTSKELKIPPTVQNLMDVQEKYKIIFDVNSFALYNIPSLGISLSLIPIFDKLEYIKDKNQAPVLFLYPYKDFAPVFYKLEEGGYVERIVYEGKIVPGVYRIIKKPDGKEIEKIPRTIFRNVWNEL